MAYMLTVDHVVAKINGGTSKDDNLVTACRSCNSRKAASDKRGVQWDPNVPPDWIGEDMFAGEGDELGQLGE